VAVTAAHRGAAFEACRHVIDQVKERVPIWKKEYYADGATEWINSTGGPVSPGPTMK
jgi:molybdopterin synthase catalytic subunit